MTNVTAATDAELESLSGLGFPRVCGETHQPDCHHRRVMREAIVDFLRADLTRRALLAALAFPELLPEQQADSILAHLSSVVPPEVSPKRYTAVNQPEDRIAL